LPGTFLISSCGRGDFGYLPPDNVSEKGLIENKDDNKTKFNEVILFCGNPGVGKSTLCNSIFGEAIFQSGVSLGKGMTTHKQEHIYKNKWHC